MATAVDCVAQRHKSCVRLPRGALYLRGVPRLPMLQRISDAARVMPALQLLIHPSGSHGV
jgi:hypothetical protein